MESFWNLSPFLPALKEKNLICSTRNDKNSRLASSTFWKLYRHLALPQTSRSLHLHFAFFSPPLPSQADKHPIQLLLKMPDASKKKPSAILIRARCRDWDQWVEVVPLLIKYKEKQKKRSIMTIPRKSEGLSWWCFLLHKLSNKHMWLVVNFGPSVFLANVSASLSFSVLFFVSDIFPSQRGYGSRLAARKLPCGCGPRPTVAFAAAFHLQSLQREAIRHDLFIFMRHVQHGSKMRKKWDSQSMVETTLNKILLNKKYQETSASRCRVLEDFRFTWSRYSSGLPPQRIGHFPGSDATSLPPAYSMVPLPPWSFPGTWDGNPWDLQENRWKATSPGEEPVKLPARNRLPIDSPASGVPWSTPWPKFRICLQLQGLASF